MKLVSPDQPSDAAIFPWVGGLLVVAVVAGLLLYLMYRRNKRRYLSDD